jgi:PilZ domain
LLTRVETRLENGASVYLLLTDTKGKNPVEVEGIVVHTERKGKDWHVGVEFTGLSQSAKTGISRLMKGLK